MNDLDLFFLPSFLFGVAMMMYGLWCDRDHIFRISDNSSETTIPMRPLATIPLYTTVQKSRKNAA